MEQLLLLCRALSSPTLCRFIPALSARPSLILENQRLEKRPLTGPFVRSVWICFRGAGQDRPRGGLSGSDRLGRQAGQQGPQVLRLVFHLLFTYLLCSRGNPCRPNRPTATHGAAPDRRLAAQVGSSPLPCRSCSDGGVPSNVSRSAVRRISNACPLALLSPPGAH